MPVKRGWASSGLGAGWSARRNATAQRGTSKIDPVPPASSQVPLSAYERLTLRRWAQDPGTRPYLAVRARIVLAVAEGWWSTQEIAERLDVSTATVSKWRAAFAKDRLRGLKPRGKRRQAPNYPRHLAKANRTRSDAAGPATAARAAQVLEHLGSELPEHLVAAGRLRIAHPDASLQELASMVHPPLTKHAFAGRLRRLLDCAEGNIGARQLTG